MSGELCYFTIGVPDTQRAQAFYGGLFGWEFTPGNVADGHNISGVNPPGGLHGAGEASSPQVYFQVEDLQAAIGRVRELGGQVEEPQVSPAGSYAACRDDQGTRFSIYQSPSGG